LKTLGDHLRKRRLDLGLLQRDAARQLSINEMTLCNWETKRTSPQLRFIARIVAYLGYSPYQPQSDSLGKRILAHRRFLGLSQKELAWQLGLDPSTLGRWESGKGKPSEVQQHALLDWLSGSQLR